MLLATGCGPREFWFFALYGHPRISKDHTIRSGIFDEEGWLLEVSPTLPFRIGLRTFKLNDASSAVYRTASYTDGEWILSAPIAKAGAFLAPEQIDGSQTYVGGMALYYGVGEAGLYKPHGGKINTNRVFIARAGETGWLLESYVSSDCGKTYNIEQIIKNIPFSENIKIWRPIVPIYAQDNLPVYRHEGIYSGHTGGWRCDEVMYIEYDD